MTSTPEFFINMKSIPDKDSAEYSAFFQEELNKIKYGVTINGVYVSGWLYWHINQWKITMDTLDPVNKDIIRSFQRPQLRDNEWMIAEYLKRAEDEQKGLTIFGSRRLGKALRNDELLRYVGEWKPIGQAKVGDEIYGADGKLTKITHVFPQGKIKTYRVNFSDGRSVVCCDEHLWYVYDYQASKYKTLPLKEILNSKITFVRKRKPNDTEDLIRSVNNFYIPVCKPMDFPEVSLPIDPYLLGLWLGDGCTGKPVIVSNDEETKNYLYDFAEKNSYLIHTLDNLHFYIKEKVKNNNNRLLDNLSDLGIRYDKRIPSIYLNSSKEQRLELLKGLMDTDGYCSNDGSISFCQSKKNLMEDVRSLALSLGIHCYIKEKTTNYTLSNGELATTEILTLFTDEIIFNLTRKKERQKVLNNNKRKHVAITSVIEEGLEEATCIKVDNEDKLFVTSDYIVTHNSVFASSYIGRSATIHQTSENIIVGNNTADIAVITSLMDKGLLAVHDHFKFGRILDDWKKEVSLGFKNKKSERMEWSRIYIRNTDGGKITEVLAGTTPKSLLMDEIGKAPILEVFNSAIPSFSTPYGWRCVPILTGTSGSFEKAKDSEKIFNDPDTYNMISMYLPDEGNKKTCVFMPGTYSLEYPKEPKSLSEHLKLTEPSELDDIIIHCSDVEKNKEKILEKRRQLEKARDEKTLLKDIMYFPLTSDECFLSENGNMFPVEGLKRHLDFLLEKNQTGEAVRLFRDIDAKVVSELTPSKKFIEDYPHAKSDNLDAPFMIYEYPMEDPPAFLYIAGLDPYNVSTSSNSDSLGCLYIYKRMYDPVGGTFQKRIVASYAARPDTLLKFYENVELLLEYYNATAMIENMDNGIIQYLDNKNKSSYLADGFSLLKEITPKTSITNRNKGLPATMSVINFCMDLLLEYCSEELVIDYDMDGNPIKALGLIRITDIMLLKELIAYRKGANADRIVAFRHILAYDTHLEKYYSSANLTNTPKKDFIGDKLPRSPFIIGGNPFATGKRLFT